MDMDADRPAVAHIARVHDFPAEGEEPPHDFVLASISSGAKVDLYTWHCRLGHLHEDTVLYMLKHGLICGMDLSETQLSTTPCQPCLKGKQTQSNIPKQTVMHADTILRCIHSDLCGPLSMQSHSGFKYFATFTDDKSRKVYVAGMQAVTDCDCKCYYQGLHMGPDLLHHWHEDHYCRLKEWRDKLLYSSPSQLEVEYANLRKWKCEDELDFSMSDSAAFF